MVDAVGICRAARFWSRPCVICPKRPRRFSKLAGYTHHLEAKPRPIILSLGWSVLTQGACGVGVGGTCGNSGRRANGASRSCVAVPSPATAWTRCCASCIGCGRPGTRLSTFSCAPVLRSATRGERLTLRLFSGLMRSPPVRQPPMPPKKSRKRFCELM